MWLEFCVGAIPKEPMYNVHTQEKVQLLRYQNKLTYIIGSSRGEVIISTDSCVVAQPAGGRTRSYVGMTAVPIRKSVIQHHLFVYFNNNDPFMFNFKNCIICTNLFIFDVSHITERERERRRESKRERESEKETKKDGDSILK